MGKLYLYAIQLQSLKQPMKQSTPSKELRLLLTNLCNTYNFSVQTLHTTINILMNPSLSAQANQDPNICIAALVLSQKFHETIVVSVSELCYCARLEESTVLGLQQIIFRSIGFRIAESLLVDECFEVASNWDRFIRNISCIDVRFFINMADQNRLTSQIHSINFEDKQQSTDNKISRRNTAIFAYRNITQICQKLAYNPKTQKYNKYKLSLAIIALVIKQTQRYQQRTCINASQYANVSNQDYDIVDDEVTGQNLSQSSRKNNQSRSRSKNSKIVQRMHKIGRRQHKSTEFIIADFIEQVYHINYQKQLSQYIKYVKSNNFGLRDITAHFNNIKNITERSAVSIMHGSNTKRAIHTNPISNDYSYRGRTSATKNVGFYQNLKKIKTKSKNSKINASLSSRVKIK